MKNLHTKKQAPEVILVGWFSKCQSIKKVGGRRFVEGLYQALFSFCLARRNVIYKLKRKENWAWSQATFLSYNGSFSICDCAVIIKNYSLKSRWIVAKYSPSRESGELNIPKATIHRDSKECFFIYTHEMISTKIREKTIKKQD